MAKLHAIGKATIRVYANDHLRPHFHVTAPEDEALIDIATLAILRGALPGKLRAAALSWAIANIDAIKTEWNRVNPRFPMS